MFLGTVKKTKTSDNSCVILHIFQKSSNFLKGDS